LRDKIDSDYDEELNELERWLVGGRIPGRPEASFKLDPGVAEELVNRLDKLIQLRASMLQLDIYIELHAERVKISKALRDHKHTASGEVMIPYELQK